MVLEQHLYFKKFMVTWTLTESQILQNKYHLNYHQNIAYILVVIATADSNHMNIETIIEWRRTEEVG